ncbi:MAG: tetratricopeptide repeat protein [Gemmatimonadales bacterium]|nr:MAG: tetratricopeptide repeat protein [Gemmatimonadales bacterium]
MSGQKKGAEPDDAFVAGVLEFTNWAKANQTTLAIFGVVLAVIIIGVISYSSQRERQLQQAGIQLEQIQVSVGVGDPDGAKVGLSQFLEQFGNTPYAGEAALLLGQLYLESAQPDLALRALERVDIAPGDPLGAQALTLQARAQEMTGSLAEAEETYLQIADGAPMAFERTAARASAARVRALRGNPSGAAELYREILEEMEATDPDRGLYEMRLAEAEAAARG